MARVRVRGLEKLTRLARSMEHAKTAMRKASEIGAETTLNLISQGFKSGSDPYGTPWDAPNNLQIAGGIRRYAKSNVGPSGWKVHSTDEKAIWHHAPQPRAAWGGKSLPTRLQVPTKSRGLPANWQKRITRALKEALLHALRK